jgi:hypothetical protein
MRSKNHRHALARLCTLAAQILPVGLRQGHRTPDLPSTTAASARVFGSSLSQP